MWVFMKECLLEARGMGRYEKLKQAILSGNRDDNFDFNDIAWFVEKSGYEE